MTSVTVEAKCTRCFHSKWLRRALLLSVMGYCYLFLMVVVTKLAKNGTLDTKEKE